MDRHGCHYYFTSNACNYCHHHYICHQLCCHERSLWTQTLSDYGLIVDCNTILACRLYVHLLRASCYSLNVSHKNCDTEFSLTIACEGYLFTIMASVRRPTVTICLHTCIIKVFTCILVSLLYKNSNIKFFHYFFRLGIKHHSAEVSDNLTSFQVEEPYLLVQCANTRTQIFKKYTYHV